MQPFPSSFITILFWLFGDGFQLIMNRKRSSLSCWVSKFLASPHWCTHWSVLTLVPTLLTLSSAHTAVRCCILVPTFLNISLSTALLLSWQTTTAVSLDLRWLYYFILYTAHHCFILVIALCLQTPTTTVFKTDTALTPTSVAVIAWLSQ